MAYGRIYIDNLKNKVTGIFNELQEEKRLCEHNFIDAFKREYPKDYAMLQYEWEFKVHEFKKNRIPIMKDMGNVEVAKAIIAEQNNDKPTEVNENKPKSNRGRKPKAKTENNIEVVK